MKNYLNILSLLLVVLAFSTVTAQQNKVSTHYTVNPYLYNPAQVGESGYTSLSLHYRNQWTKMPESPDTKLFSAQGMINDKFGIGTKVYIDKAHIVENYGALFSYAYYIRMKKNPERHYLSIGLSAGFKHQQLSFDEATIDDLDDPSIFYDGVSKTVFDAEAGIRYRAKGFNMGFFVSNLSPHTYNYARDENSLDYSPAYHVYGSMGYDIYMGKKKTFSMRPSVLVRYIPDIPIQFDANLLFNWNEKLWFGGGYRYKNTGAWGIAGFRIHDNVAATYSYEQSIDGLQASLGSSHEISLEFRFKKKDKEIQKELEDKMDDLRRKMLVKNRELIDSLAALEDEIVDLEAKMEDLKENSSTTTVHEGKEVKYIPMGQVNFFVNSAVLHDEQISEAEEIYNLMKPSLNKGEVVLIRIVGSASIEGSEEYNLLLSNRRTETMREYLVREGVDPDLIITSYKGNSEAIARDIFEENDDAEPNPEDRYVKVYMMITQ